MAVWDGSEGTQRIFTLPGGGRMECGHIDLTSFVGADLTVASHLNTLVTLVGHAECSLGCVSGTMSKGVTNYTLCSGLIEISIGDVSAGTDSAEFSYIAIGW